LITSCQWPVATFGAAALPAFARPGTGGIVN